MFLTGRLGLRVLGLERVVAYTTAAVQMAFKQADAGEAIALARLACQNADGRAEHAALLRTADDLLALAQTARSAEPADARAGIPAVMCAMGPGRHAGPASSPISLLAAPRVCVRGRTESAGRATTVFGEQLFDCRTSPAHAGEDGGPTAGRHQLPTGWGESGAPCTPDAIRGTESSSESIGTICAPALSTCVCGRMRSSTTDASDSGTSTPPVASAPAACARFEVWGFSLVDRGGPELGGSAWAFLLSRESWWSGQAAHVFVLGALAAKRRYPDRLMSRRAHRLRPQRH